MSLFREVMYSKAPVLKMHSEFYGDYSSLNNVDCPSEQMIQEYQLAKLKEFQALAIKNDIKAQKINKFLIENGNLSTSSEQYDKIVYESINNMFQQINQLISTGAMSKKTRQALVENKVLENNIVQKLVQLGNSLNQLRSFTNQTISSTYIDHLDNLIAQLPNGDLDQVLRTLYHLKGDILEEIGTNWFNERIPSNLNVRAYSTGAIRGKSGQLIQDILVMDMDQIDLNQDVKISFKLGAQGAPKEMGLGDFLNFIENHSGQEQIILQLEAEDILSKLSLFGIQAKSGVNQLPWNTGSKNTWANIIDGGTNNYTMFLDHLQQLYISWDEEHKNIKKSSPVYSTMANYQLATQLSKVLHLSQMDNQYVLTPNGFMPYISRILELYEKKGGGRYMFSFGGKVVMEDTGDLLTKMRPVILGE